MASTWKIRHQALNKMFPPGPANAINLAMTKHITTMLPAATTATQSSTTLAAIDAVNFRLDDFQAGGTHVIEGQWNLSIAAAGDNIKFDFNGGTATATSVAGFARFSLANGTNLVVPVTALNTAINGATTNAWIAVEFYLTVVIATPGSIVPQFAQSVSGASNSTVSAAYLRATNLN